jgi:hypothetical protein
LSSLPPFVCAFPLLHDAAIAAIAAIVATARSEDTSVREVTMKNGDL